MRQKEKRSTKRARRQMKMLPCCKSARSVGRKLFRRKEKDRRDERQACGAIEKELQSEVGKRMSTKQFDLIRLRAEQLRQTLDFHARTQKTRRAKAKDLLRPQPEETENQRSGKHEKKTYTHKGGRFRYLLFVFAPVGISQSTPRADICAPCWRCRPKRRANPHPGHEKRAPRPKGVPRGNIPERRVSTVAESIQISASSASVPFVLSVL